MSTATKKFLVNAAAFPDGARRDGVTHLRGYLSYEPLVTVRAYASDVDGKRGFTNAASDEPPWSPLERERRVEYHAALELLGRCEGVLEFVRHRAKHGAHLWSVDQFAGKHEGLWLASIELDDAGEGFEKPAWLGREVTRDARYEDAALSRGGVPDEAP